MPGTNQQVLVLALLDAMQEHGSWCGETHVQKCAYFLQEALDVPLECQFVLYKHGPFSFDLRSTLGELRADLLIDVKSKYPYGPSLEVSTSAKRLLKRHSDAVHRYESPIAFVAKRLSTRGVADLERLGTALYVTKQVESLSPDGRATRITEVKPHIPRQLARAAVEEVDRLLVEARACAPTA